LAGLLTDWRESSASRAFMDERIFLPMFFSAPRWDIRSADLS
jgi:hypothetical protein